jgi:hypothetical protein
MGEAKRLVGSVLGDTFRLERLLGEGGMGAVYEAAHLRLDRRFAIKVLLESSASNKEMLARFQREARITSGIGHPNIVDVTDFQHLPDGRPYIVMELLEGEDLGGRMERQPRFELSEAASILEQAAAGLQAAHDKGIVHRDLKPQNIFLCRRGEAGLLVKVLDFGISKVLTTKSRLTRTRALLGTPYYMAPEQAEQKQAEVGLQTDVWAMGAIMFEMVAGVPPFEADSVPGLLYLIVHKPPPALQELRPDLPESARLVIEKAISKRPEDRYASMTEFAEEFARSLEVTQRAQPAAEWAETQPVSRVETDEWETVAIPPPGDRTVPEAEVPPEVVLQPEDLEDDPFDGQVTGEAPTLLAGPDQADLPTGNYPTAPMAAVPRLTEHHPPAAARPVVQASKEPPAGDEPVEPAQVSRQARLTTISLGAGEVLQRIKASVGWWGIAAFAVVVVGGLAGLFYGLLRQEPKQIAAAEGPRAEPAAPARVPAPQQPDSAASTTGPPSVAPAAKVPAQRPVRLLWLSSKPDGADVFLDGRRVGVTPINGAEISQRRTKVEVARDGFELWTRHVEEGTERVVLHVVLTPEAKPVVAEPAPAPKPPAKPAPKPPGRPAPRTTESRANRLCSLRIITLSQGESVWANVYLDGRPVGQTPRVLKYVYPGPYSVRVQRDGFRPRTVKFRLRPGQQRKLTIEMEQSNAPP